MTNKRHLKCLASPVLLKPVGEAEGIVHLVVLENVQSMIQRNLPAMVGHDVAGVQSEEVKVVVARVMH